MDKKKIIVFLIILFLFIGGVFYFSKNKNQSENKVQDKVDQNVKEENNSKDNKDNKEGNIPTSKHIVTGITEKGYRWWHGDHYHFEYGRVPKDAKFHTSIVYDNKEYELKQEDIQYEVNEGYIIKIGDKYYYYPKRDIKQTSIVKKSGEVVEFIPGKTIVSNIKENFVEKDDGYVFNPKDIVDETPDGYIVKHGDHFHFIPKDQLSNEEKQAVKDFQDNNSSKGTSSTLDNKGKGIAGIDYPTDDGFLFDGNNISSRTEKGLVIKHGDHFHFIPYDQLKGTKWEYLIDNKNNSGNNDTDNNTSNNNESNDKEELEKKINYIAENMGIDPSEIVVDGDYLVVPHGDHSHAYLISDIDPSKPFIDPHHHNPYAGTDGEATLKSLGFDDEVLDAIYHADTDVEFPKNSKSKQELIDWLATIKAINIGEMKDPLTRPGLHYLKNLETLAVGFTPISDTTPILQFKNLKHLWIPRTGINNFEFLKKIEHLEGVDVSQLGLDNLDFLKGLNLTSISAAGNNISDLSILSEFPELSTINFDFNNITDISGIANNNKLKVVSFDYNNIEDLSALNNKPELNKIFVSNNKGVKLDTFKSDTIKEIEANNSDIKDLKFLSNFSALDTLLANNNKVTSLEGIENSNIKNLNLVNNLLDSSINSKSETLERLDISNNNLSRLENLDYLPNLETLLANNNYIKEVSGKNDNIGNLELNNNKIENLNFINDLTSIKNLEVKDNFITTMALDKENNSLISIDIRENPIGIDEKSRPVGLESYNAIQGGYVDPNFDFTKEYAQEKIDKAREIFNGLDLSTPYVLYNEMQDYIKSYDSVDTSTADKETLIDVVRGLKYFKEFLDEKLNIYLENHDMVSDEEFPFENVKEETPQGFNLQIGDEIQHFDFENLTVAQVQSAREYLKQNPPSEVTTEETDKDAPVEKLNADSPAENSEEKIEAEEENSESTEKEHMESETIPESGDKEETLEEN